MLLNNLCLWNILCFLPRISPPASQVRVPNKGAAPPSSPSLPPLPPLRARHDCGHERHIASSGCSGPHLDPNSMSPAPGAVDHAWTRTLAVAHAWTRRYRMPDRMSEWMPGRMLDRLPEQMPERMPDRMSEWMPGRMPDRMSEWMPGRMPDRMSEWMPGRMPDRMSE